MAVSTDPEHRFELAVSLGELETAHNLAQQLGSESKWRQLSDLALSKGDFELAQECLHKAQDFGGLLLMASAAGDAGMVKKLQDSAASSGKHNISFLSALMLGDLNGCLNILIGANRIPEAALFAR